jgi:Tol biopolymer transport system component
MPIRCLIRLFLPALLPFFILAGCGTTDPSTGVAPSPLPVIVAAATIPAPTLVPTKVLPIDPTVTPVPTILPATLVASPTLPPIATTLPAATVPAEPQAPVRHTLVFASQHEGALSLYRVAADGSHLTRLTSADEDAFFPTWSPDGQWIAFQTISQEGRQSDIFIIRPDGSQRTRLSDGTTYDSLPTWSNDAQSIAFLSQQPDDPASKVSNPSHLLQLRVDGSQRAPLDPYAPTTIDRFLSASANGQYLLNSFLFSTPQGGYNELARRMDDTFQLGRTVWSPDRQHIAFASSRDGNSEIYVVGADGNARTRLTNDPENDQFPAWSPDGRRIAFVSALEGKGGVYVMNMDGSQRTQLIADPHAVNPAWSPDGQYLAFPSDRKIVIIHLADGHTTTIYALAGSLAWSPQ